MNSTSIIRCLMQSNKNREKPLWKNPLLLAFCLPVAIMLAAVAVNRIYPFGNRSFLRIDLYNQYMPFFTELWRKIHGGGSLFYSWKSGLGGNFTAIYAYYLASPFNWLLLFCPEGLIIEFMTLLIVFKIGLCGYTFAYYLNRRYDAEGYEITLFSLFYSLSGFMAAYNWNIMWLDCVFIAPVIILGLERLLKGEGRWMYPLALAFSIYTNYYISILICFYLIFYFLILVIPMTWKERVVSALRFAIYSLLGGGLSGVMLIPGTMPLRATGFDNLDFPKKLEFYFNALDVIARHGVNVATEVRNDHWPNIYCGVAILFLIPLYVLCRQISWKEKLPRLLMLLFFLLSFMNNVLNFIWHGMNYPDSLPARQSFLYVFLLLTMGFEAWNHRKDFERKQIAGAVAFVIFCLLAWRSLSGADAPDWTAVGLTVLYVAVYGMLMLWNHAGKLKGSFLTALLFALVLSESAMNTLQTSVPTTSRDKYVNTFTTAKELAESIPSEGESTPSFYRIEEEARMTKNDGFLSGYSTATLFTSTVSEDVGIFYYRNGMEKSKVFYCFDGATPLTASLLSVSYLISPNSNLSPEIYELQGEKDGRYLYRYRNVLPLGFTVPSDLEENWEMESGNPANVQNAFVQALGISGELLTPVEVTCKEGSGSMTIPEKGTYYAYPSRISTKDMKVIAGINEKKFNKVYYKHFLELGYLEAGTPVQFERAGDKRNEKKELEVSVYKLNMDVLDQTMQVLGQEKFKLREMTDQGFLGEITAAKDCVLLTSVPAESGWSVSIDGEDRTGQLQKFKNALLSLPLTQGTHTIEFSYHPPGLLLGMAVSLISFLLLLLVIYIETSQKRETEALPSEDRHSETHCTQALPPEASE